MGHYTSRPLTVERIGALDRAAMVSFYRDRFASAGDFSFFMVGAFKVDDVLPMLTRYVGSLPSAKTPASRFKDVGISFPPTVAARAGREGEGTEEPDGHQLLCRSAYRGERADARRGRDRSARDRVA